MTAESDPSELQRSRPIPWVWTFVTIIACACVGAFGAWLHWQLRVAPWSGEGPWDVVLKPVGNLLTVGGLPGWLLVRLSGVGVSDLGGAIIANALSAAAWSCAILIALAARKRLLKPARSQLSATTDSTRRSFIVNGAGALGALTMGGAASSATIIEPLSLRTTRYRVPIADLPPSLDGFRIGFLADMHLGPRISRDFVAQAVEMARDLRADLYLLGGDYVSQSDAYMEEAAALMRPLLDPALPSLGVLGVLGNHDWWENGPRMKRALQSQGIPVIDNTRMFIDVTSRTLVEDVSQLAGPGLCIAALGDLMTDSTDFAGAFADIPADMPRVLLTHEPDTAELPELTSSAGPRVDLMLCGHTHGGQVSLPLIGAPIVPSRYGQRYAGGLVKGPRFPVIVSRGIGMSLIPVRWGVPPEVVEVTLTRK